jgi:hypothetical protein
MHVQCPCMMTRAFLRRQQVPHQRSGQGHGQGGTAEWSCWSLSFLVFSKSTTIAKARYAIMVGRANKPSALTPSTTGPQPSAHSDGKKVTASLPSGDSVEVMLFGATVTSWKNNGHENMWLSSNADMSGKKAIRGGVPVVFPVWLFPP